MTLSFILESGMVTWASDGKISHRSTTLVYEEIGKDFLSSPLWEHLDKLL